MLKTTRPDDNLVATAPRQARRPSSYSPSRSRVSLPASRRERRRDPIQHDFFEILAAACEAQPGCRPSCDRHDAPPLRKVLPFSGLISQRSGSFRRQADLSEAVTAEAAGQAPSESECVMAQLVLPERMRVRIPVIASIERDEHGEQQLLCLRRSGTKSSALVSLHVSGIKLSRHWGCMSSTHRVVELSVPGDEKEAGNVLLVLDTYDSMQRLARMVLGREMPDSTQRAKGRR